MTLVWKCERCAERSVRLIDWLTTWADRTKQMLFLRFSFAPALSCEQSASPLVAACWLQLLLGIYRAIKKKNGMRSYSPFLFVYCPHWLLRSSPLYTFSRCFSFRQGTGTCTFVHICRNCRSSIYQTKLFAELIRLAGACIEIPGGITAHCGHNGALIDFYSWIPSLGFCVANCQHYRYNMLASTADDLLRPFTFGYCSGLTPHKKQNSRSIKWEWKIKKQNKTNKEPNKVK